MSARWADIPNIRDAIIDSELAAGSKSRAEVLRQVPTLIYALEHFIRGVLLPQSALPELYKALESVRNALGGWKELAMIGVAKSDVDYVRVRANVQTDERHAPADLTTVSNLSAAEQRECLRRVRNVIEQYASTL
jgi:predicted ATP-dependent serine protease